MKLLLLFVLVAIIWGIVSTGSAAFLVPGRSTPSDEPFDPMKRIDMPDMRDLP